MAESGGLENRCVREGTVGSNPTPSAGRGGFKRSTQFLGEPRRLWLTEEDARWESDT